LAKTINENQQDWDKHLPKALLSYQTAIHESTGFTPFHVTFGHSPVLPIDIILGAPSTDKPTDVPKFVADLHCSLNAVYVTIHTNLDSAH